MSTTKMIISGAKNVAQIESQLFDVALVPLYPPSMTAFKESLRGKDDNGNKLFNNVPKDITPLVRPNYFATYRTTGGQPLGTIGKDFTATQPRELFTAFTECLRDTDVDFSKIGYRSLKGGSKIQFTAPLQDIKFKNNAKVGDVIESNVVLTTGFDGLTKTTLSLETMRLICTNGMVVKDSSINVAFKNTKGNFGKIMLACEQITKMSKNVKTFGERLRIFDAKEITKKQLDAYLTNVFGYSNKDRSELGKVKLERLDEIMASMNKEMARTGNTVWGMLNGVTHFTNHIANTDNRDDYLQVGAGYRTNNLAQRFALELVR